MKPEATAAFDPNDPHHFADLGEHHGHHITSAAILIRVIVALVILTALTVGASQVESYLVTEMGWQLPDWLNASIAMSIAVVKGALVLMFFMALKYENPLYTIVFLFCMFAFALFLGLTGMDLDNRGYVYDWKKGVITEGGLGGSVIHPPATIHIDGETIEFHDLDGNGNKKPFAFTGPLTLELRKRYIEQTGISEEEYWRRWAEENHIHTHEQHLSTADRSITRVGLSGALDTAAPAGDAHGAESSEGHQPAGH